MTTPSNGIEDAKFTDGFLRNWFPKLPRDIIERVCEYLPPTTIKRTLLKAPKLRKHIIDIFYTKELHLLICPPEEYHFFAGLICKYPLINIIRSTEIDRFLLENPDINPHRLRVVIKKDFKSFKKLLQRFYYRLSHVPRLEIYIEELRLSLKDLDILGSFQNLLKLDLWSVEFETPTQLIISRLSSLSNLSELSFWDYKVYDEVKFVFPANLTQLDILWDKCCRLPRYRTMPPRITEETHRLFEALSSLRRLKYLKLSRTVLPVINVSRLPYTLETLDLTGSQLQYFEYDQTSPYWPPFLKSIKLGTNRCLDDSSLQQLAGIKWPPFLENLELSHNMIKSLEHLTNLPQSLKTLDLSATEIKNLSVQHNKDKYPFFKFPVRLEKLIISFIENDTENQVAHGGVPLGKRVRFPPNLKHLDIHGMNDVLLACFVFPTSLNTLSLRGRIKDLTVYNFTWKSTEIVSWKNLTNLRDLDLSCNRIESLETWFPPNALKVLNLSLNPINNLDSWCPPNSLQRSPAGVFQIRP